MIVSVFLFQAEVGIRYCCLSRGLGDVYKGQVAADAIISTTNEELRAGAGVCGAIFRAAGIAPLEEACAEIGHCPTGSAVITPAFGIKSAKYIVHAVGPVYASHAPDESRRLLRSAYRTAIKVAAENGCKTIAFPAISTGVYRYPKDAACRIALGVGREYDDRFREIRYVCFSDEDLEVYRRILKELETSP